MPTTQPEEQLDWYFVLNSLYGINEKNARNLADFIEAAVLEARIDENNQTLVYNELTRVGKDELKARNASLESQKNNTSSKGDE